NETIADCFPARLTDNVFLSFLAPASKPKTLRCSLRCELVDPTLQLPTVAHMLRDIEQIAVRVTTHGLVIRYESYSRWCPISLSCMPFRVTQFLVEVQLLTRGRN